MIRELQLVTPTSDWELAAGFCLKVDRSCLQAIKRMQEMVKAANEACAVDEAVRMESVDFHGVGAGGFMQASPALEKMLEDIEGGGQEYFIGLPISDAIFAGEVVRTELQRIRVYPDGDFVFTASIRNSGEGIESNILPADLVEGAMKLLD